MKGKYKFVFIGDTPAEVFFIQNVISLDRLPIDPYFFLTPEQAMFFLAKLNEKKFPDVILVNSRLPVYNGYDFAIKYRSAFHYSYPTTLLFITSVHLSHQGKEEIRKNTAITGFLPKPFTSDRFAKEILHHLQTRKQRKEPVLQIPEQKTGRRAPGYSKKHTV